MNESATEIPIATSSPEMREVTRTATDSSFGIDDNLPNTNHNESFAIGLAANMNLTVNPTVVDGHFQVGGNLSFPFRVVRRMLSFIPTFINMLKNLKNGV